MRTLLSAVASLILSANAAPGTCPPWEAVPTPSPVDAQQAVIRDIDAIAQDDVWAVGSYFNGRILQMAMHWDGAAWEFFDVPVFSAIGNGYLWSVEANGSDDIWAAGSQERAAPDGFFGTHILVVRWDGTRWNLLDTPVMSGGSGDFVWDIEIVAPDEIWFVGEGHPVPVSPQPSLAMIWDGDSFEIIPTPIINERVSEFGNGNGLRAIDALSPDDLWAVGAGGDGDPIIGASQILHWNGSQWEHRPGPIPGFWHSLDAVVAIAPDDAWAGGEYFDGSYHGFAIHWDGSSWTQVPVPGGITDFVAFAGDDIYASGAGVMHWDGAAWSFVETFPQVVGPSLTGIDALGPCEMWTAGRRLVGDAIFNFAARVLPATPCAVDLNADGTVTIQDFLAFLGLYSAGDARADFNADAAVTVQDFLAFTSAYAMGCS